MYNSLASPRSIGTSGDIASKTETAQEVLAKNEKSVVFIFLQCIPDITFEIHTCERYDEEVPVGHQNRFRYGYGRRSQM